MMNYSFKPNIMKSHELQQLLKEVLTEKEMSLLKDSIRWSFDEAYDNADSNESLILATKLFSGKDEFVIEMENDIKIGK